MIAALWLELRLMNNTAESQHSITTSPQPSQCSWLTPKELLAPASNCMCSHYFKANHHENHEWVNNTTDSLGTTSMSVSIINHHKSPGHVRTTLLVGSPRGSCSSRAFLTALVSSSAQYTSAPGVPWSPRSVWEPASPLPPGSPSPLGSGLKFITKSLVYMQVLQKQTVHKTYIKCDVIQYVFF